jgi:hypothetical protein
MEFRRRGKINRRKPKHIYKTKESNRNAENNRWKRQHKYLRKTIEILNKIVQIGDLSLKWTSSTHLAKLQEVQQHCQEMVSRFIS